MIATGNQRRLICCVLLLSAVCLPVFAVAGNKAMVEKRVEELDDLNRSAVQQVPGLPRSGVVELKARVVREGDSPDIEILEKRVIVKEEAISFTQKKTATEMPPEEGSDESKKP